MNMKIRMAALAVAAALSGTAQAALYDRGGGLIYDSDLMSPGSRTPTTPGPEATTPMA